MVKFLVHEEKQLERDSANLPGIYFVLGWFLTLNVKTLLDTSSMIAKIFAAWEKLVMIFHIDRSMLYLCLLNKPLTIIRLE